MRMLVSVRDVAEAREAMRAGVDFIDLKEPSAGALGGLALPVIREVVAALRAGGLPLTLVGRPRESDDLAFVDADFEGMASLALDHLAGQVEAGAPRFEGVALERVRRMRRLMRDFEASFTAAAMMMELIDEIERLRRLLERAGIPWRDEP